MANIKILDTGYLSADRTGTPLAVTLRAGYDGSGTVSPFTLKVESLNKEGNSLIDNSPIPNSGDQTKTIFIGFENNGYALNCIVSKDQSNTGYQYDYLYQLSKLEKTSGMKLLYVDSTTDGTKTIVERFGNKNVSGVFQGSGKELSASTPYLIGRVKKVRIGDDAKGDKYRISINFEETI